MILNFQYLEDVAKGRSDFLVKLLLKLKDNASKLPKEINNCIENKNYIHASELAHKLKSSVNFLGIEELNQALIFIESTKDMPVNSVEENELIEKAALILELCNQVCSLVAEKIKNLQNDS